MPFLVTVRPGFSVNLGSKTINTINAQTNTLVVLTDYECSRDVSPSAVSESDIKKPIVSVAPIGTGDDPEIIARIRAISAGLATAL